MQRVSFDNSSASTTQCRGCTSPRLRQLHNRHALGLEQRLQRRLLLQLAHFPLWLPPEWLITAAPSESRHATAQRCPLSSLFDTGTLSSFSAFSAAPRTPFPARPAVACSQAVCSAPACSSAVSMFWIPDATPSPFWPPTRLSARFAASTSTP